MQMPYELFFHIATFCKPRRLCTLALTCRSSAPLCNDDSLFRILVLTRYKHDATIPQHMTWKDLFCFIFALHRRLANKHVPPSMASYVSYDIYIRPGELRHPCNCKSTFGFNVHHKQFLGKDAKGRVLFTPFHLHPMERKINLYAINFERHARKIKFSIEADCADSIELGRLTSGADLFPPFNSHMIIADGMVFWSLEERKYVVVYEMELIFKYFCRKHASSMGERIPLVEHDD